MSSTELDDAASISITSSELAEAIDTHESQTPQGCTVGPFTQFRQAARIFAIDVLPVPREPTNR
jgi:bifunctional N-acetylglucosamine-1-phosphate-uridyltransferase/glucosamine-1-phosphate-acetyltransferase GlmU-like protein